MSFAGQSAWQGTCNFCSACVQSRNDFHQLSWPVHSSDGCNDSESLHRAIAQASQEPRNAIRCQNCDSQLNWSLNSCSLPESLCIERLGINSDPVCRLEYVTKDGMTTYELHAAFLRPKRGDAATQERLLLRWGGKWYLYESDQSPPRIIWGNHVTKTLRSADYLLYNQIHNE